MYKKENTQKKLTDEQRAFAEQHHDEVVYGFLATKGLDRDEFWNVVILKYLYAVRIYLERPDLRRYSFKTIAYRQMRSAVCDYYTYLNRPKRNAQVCSYEELSESGVAAGSNAGIPEYVEAAETLREIMPLLTDKEVDSLQKKAQGYTYREIARQAGITYSGIASRFFRARNKARICVAQSTQLAPAM